MPAVLVAIQRTPSGSLVACATSHSKTSRSGCDGNGSFALPSLLSANNECATKGRGGGGGCRLMCSCSPRDCRANQISSGGSGSGPGRGFHVCSATPYSSYASRNLFCFL